MLAAQPWLGLGPGRSSEPSALPRSGGDRSLPAKTTSSLADRVGTRTTIGVLALAEDGSWGRAADRLPADMLVPGRGRAGLRRDRPRRRGSAAIGVLANACSTSAVRECGSLDARLRVFRRARRPGERRGLTGPDRAHGGAPGRSGSRCLLALPALSLARHGRALAELAHARTLEIEGACASSRRRSSRSSARALAQRPIRWWRSPQRAQALRSTRAQCRAHRRVGARGSPSVRTVSKRSSRSRTSTRARAALRRRERSTRGPRPSMRPTPTSRATRCSSNRRGPARDLAAALARARRAWPRSRR